MTEYIKKEDIEQKIQDGLNNLVLGHDAIEVLGMIYVMPAADVAPVVRCKDCKYSWEDISGLTCSYGCCVDCIVREDFFCADGERKDGDGND